MSKSEIEAQINPRVRNAINAAIEKVGRKEFSAITGIDPKEIERLLSLEGEYVKVTVVSVACQVSKSHGDPDPTHSSVSECLKGATYRIPQPDLLPSKEPSAPRRVNMEELRASRASGTFFDQKSGKILNFSANTISFLILGYFLGGIGIGPLFGLPQCVGVTSTAPWIAPCLGSGLGLVLGSFIGLAYTYYYFVKKL